MRSFLFPDVNVWLALLHEGHRHHSRATEWFGELDDDSILYFCRFTQLSLLRLLTTEAVMGPDVLSQEQAWGAYRQLLANARVDFHPEPGDDRFEGVFESLSATGAASPKRWADAYLAAFASTAGLRLVTFDVALSSLAGVAVGLD